MMDLFGDTVKELDLIDEKSVKKDPVPALFDWLKSINSTKEDLQLKDPTLRGYEPFIICKGLGQSQATIGFANLMNRLAHIPKEQQYRFLRLGLPRNNAYAKWAKEDKYDKLKEVMAKLGYSKDKAKEAINVLGTDGVKKLLHVSGGKSK